MCCFAGPVLSVNNTRIFARLLEHSSPQGLTSQLIAYQMTYKSEQPNAMILPIPAKHGADETSIQFIDLSGYERFFSDLRKGFPRLSPPPRTAIDSRVAVGSPRLEVQRVGKFIASFVPKAEDFARLDPQFSIPKETWAKIPEYDDYSFAVFRLVDLEGEPHPMAFEFETRFPDTIFFPTVHIHDGEVHSTEHFAHELYCQHEEYDKLVSTKYSEKAESQTNLVRSVGPASEFVDVAKTQGMVDGRLLMHRLRMHGSLPNQDVLLSAKGAAGKVGLLRSRWLGPALTLLPLAWIVKRRNELRQKRQ